MGADFYVPIFHFMDERAIMAYVCAIITSHGAIIGNDEANVAFHSAAIIYYGAYFPYL
jgi:hypothetical protein